MRSCERKTRVKNRLHKVLYSIWNTDYEQKFRDPFSKKALNYWSRSRPDADPYTVAHMKRLVRRLQDITTTIAALENAMKELLDTFGSTLPSMNGCGTVVAATIIGEIGDISRFHSVAHLAKYAGCAPREHSSGKKIRHYKTRGGNRQLNAAFHRLALCQISRSGNAAAKRYFHRKITEGKSKGQALVCLRRQLVNVVWMLLTHNTEYRWPE